MQTNKYPKSRFIKELTSLHMYVRDIRILTPNEYQLLLDNIPKRSHKALFELLMMTGMRYIEVQRLYDHPEWYNEKKNIVHLPQEAQLKVKRKQLERTIYPLPNEFKYIWQNFIEGSKPPEKCTWNQNLQRWAKNAGIEPYGISAKTTRKTIESWCIAGGVLESAVCLRQGHDNLTSMRHYQGLAFDDHELQDIRSKLKDWKLLN